MKNLFLIFLTVLITVIILLMLKPYSHHIMSVTYPNHKSEECKILKDEIGFQTRLASGNIKNIKEDRLRFRKVKKELLEKRKEAREKNIDIPEIEELDKKLRQLSKDNTWEEMNKNYLNEQSIALVLLYNEYCK